MKQIQKCLALLLIFCLCVSLVTVFAATGILKTNSGRRHVACTSLSKQAQKYYTGDYTWDKLTALPGVYAPKDSWAATQNNALYTALQTLMTDTHTNQKVVYSGYSSNALATYWKSTDAAGGAKGYMYFYGDVDSGTTSYTMNREHIWCKANASFYQTGGGSDLHHLRPSISFINAAKNYYAFGYVKGKYADATASTLNGAEVCWASTSKELFEVKDDIKGDVARILLYVYCRWAQPNLYTNVAKSKLPAMDADDSLNYGEKVVENLDVLFDWMQLDPVDEWEMGRNDQTENVQGNRNVFIDYPELAWLMFGQAVPTDMQTPSGHAAEGLQPAQTEPTEPSSEPTEPTEPTEPEECPTKDFSDVPPEGHWAHAGIDYVVSNGIMGSTSTGKLTFEPSTTCTRAMIVSMLYSLTGKPATGFEGRFSDVPAGQWYSKAVIWAYRNGVVSGYDNGCFGPNDVVTREQLAMILMQYANKVEGKSTDGRASLADFLDEDKVTWSREAVRWAVDVKMISGKLSNNQLFLAPQGKASRAEAAVILMRYMQEVLEK